MGVMNSDNENLIRAALDSGIVHLDTAHVYMRGRNEEIIGGVIKDRPRDSYLIATKVPAIADGSRASARHARSSSRRSTSASSGSA